MTTITKAGRYELHEELGRGAMGVVYHGHDPVIGRDVAVKTMHLSAEGTGMSRAELVNRFQTEARAAGLLSHPNIVVIYDAGEEEGLFYITMEMVEGRSLQTLLDSRQLFPLPRVIKLMEQVCSALDFAHQHNVVHRDIKPANLVLTADDTVKITDFGTAKILQFGTAQTAHVMGTPSYMSPEQVKGKPVDGRSDIFSLGVILYELMTGEKPFPGQNITTVIYKIINEEPIPPRSLDSSIHPGLSTVITRALAKNPNARFQNCRELLDALKNYREQISPDATLRMAPVSTPPASGGDRPSTLADGAQSAPLTRASTDSPSVSESDATIQLVSAATLEAEASSKKRGSLVLALVLLGIIVFAAYRIRPAMADLWKLAHQPVEKRLTEPKTIPQAPEPNSEPPDVKPGTGMQSAPPEPKITPSAAESATTQQMAQPAPEQAVAPAPRQIASSTSAATGVAPEPAPGSTLKPAAPQAPTAIPSTSAANIVETRLRTELARLSVADKVKVQVAANTVILSGRVTPAEHRLLLNRLHWVPTAVRVIDDLEYTEELGPGAASATVGWVWVRSEPQGARIVVDGTDTGLRTPARLEMTEGEHEVRLNRGEFPPAQRTVVVRAGQTMQFTQPLAEQ